jgi:anaerobic selenocysteine-containing dehydrogenase
MFNFVRLSEGGAPPVSPEMWSEVEIVASIAARVLPRQPIDWEQWKNHRALREQIARVVPGFAALAEIDQSKREFTIDGRVRHEPQFATADGRAHLHVTAVPESPAGPGEMRLMTLRSEGQFNTVVYEYDDVYRGVKGRDVVMMCGADARRLGLRPGDRVELVNATGRYGPVRVVLLDIREGNLAVYYPEANVLVPRHVDPKSRTPVFKSVGVRVEKHDQRATPP